MIQKRSDLGYLGEGFQYQLVHEFMENHTFFEDLSSIVDQNMFTEPNLKTIVGVMKNFYDKKGQVPSYGLMEIELRDISYTEREMETYLAVLNKVHDSPSDGVETIRELAEKFFKQQNIIKTANEILKIAGNGDTSKYEACVGLLNDAMTKGTHNDFGEGVFDHIAETLSDDYRVPIPTGIDKIDETLEGGLGKGELGVIIAPSGVGKAQPLTSKVLTNDGYKLMGQIKVGDYVMGADGNEHKVIGVFPQGKRPVYKVTFSNGVSCECDIDHLWNVNSFEQRNNTINVNGTIVKSPDYSFSTKTLREILRLGLMEKGEFNFAVPLPKPMNFTKKDISIDPYILGRFSKSKIHSNYLFSSLDDRVALLQGLLDGNGHCTDSGDIEFSSDDKEFLEQVCFLAKSLGFFVNICKDETILISSSDTSFEFFKTKKEKSNIRLNEEKYLYIEDVEYLREDETQCIYIDSDEHLYITDGFVVTHNSSMTTAMASHAALNGHKVLQIVFEDRIKQIQRKHIGRLTNIESKDLSKKENIDHVREIISKYQKDGVLQENLRIVKFPSGEKTARQIKTFIQKLINNGFKPDLVIIDYFECLAHESDKNSTNEFEKEGKTMRFFEAMAGELDIALWIPSQGTKDSINLELITMDKIGGSVKKAQIAHIILSIARTVDDIANNKATIAILKNRAGKSGKVFNNVGFNNGTCRITTDEVDECDSLFEVKEKKKEATFELQKKIMDSMENGH